MGAPAWDSTRVIARGGGRYDAVVGAQWDLAMVPQGGVAAAVAARAMGVELGTDQPLRALHGVSASPVPHGPLEVDVGVLRAGRSVSQAQASVRAPGRSSGFSALAVFGGTRPGFAFTELAAPEVPGPDACPSFRDPPPPEVNPDWDGPWPFWGEVLEGRSASGKAPWDDTPSDVAEVVQWLRFDEQPTGPDGDLDPLALLVLADVMPGAVFQRLEPVERGWFAPSIDLSVHILATASPGWILSHVKAHAAGDGYATAEAALWDPRGPDGPKLVAWAAQQMLFTKVD